MKLLVHVLVIIVNIKADNLFTAYDIGIILRTCFFSIQKIISAQPRSPDITLTLELFSVPAERAECPL